MHRLSGSVSVTDRRSLDEVGVEGENVHSYTACTLRFD
jgi:hypothetical protein